MKVIHFTLDINLLPFKTNWCPCVLGIPKWFAHFLQPGIKFIGVLVDCKKSLNQIEEKKLRPQTSAFVKPISAIRQKKLTSSKEEKYETKVVGNGSSYFSKDNYFDEI